MNYGTWDGRAWDDIEASDGARVRAWGEDWINRAPPSGESALQLAERVRPVLDELASVIDRSGRDVIAVTHAGWIRIAATILFDEPLTAAFKRSIDYARASVFAFGERGATIEHWNVTDVR